MRKTFGHVPSGRIKVQCLCGNVVARVPVYRGQWWPPFINLQRLSDAPRHAHVKRRTYRAVNPEHGAMEVHTSFVYTCSCGAEKAISRVHQKEAIVWAIRERRMALHLFREFERPDGDIRVHRQARQQTGGTIVTLEEQAVRPEGAAEKMHARRTEMPHG